jgi:tetratricopeptide (TPR) repeat protein
VFTIRFSAAEAAFKKQFSDGLLGAKNPEVRVKLAELLERQADYADALEFYRQAAETDSGKTSQSRYEAAKNRLAALIAKDKETGKTSDATHLESMLAAQPMTSESPEVGYRRAQELAFKAMQQRRWADAEAALKSKVQSAEKLEPREARLFSAMSELGQFYDSRNRAAEAEILLRQVLALSQKINGETSVQNSWPLMTLGRHFARQHDYEAATTYFKQSLDLNEKNYSTASPHLTEILVALGDAYTAMKSYESAEAYLVQALAIEDSIHEPTDLTLATQLERLAYLYKQWNKLEKAEPYYRRLLAVEEKQYGPNNPALGTALERLADVLTGLGRTEESNQMRKRYQALLVAQTAH